MINSVPKLELLLTKAAHLLISLITRAFSTSASGEIAPSDPTHNDNCLVNFINKGRSILIKEFLQHACTFNEVGTALTKQHKSTTNAHLKYMIQVLWHCHHIWVTVHKHNSPQDMGCGRKCSNENGQIEWMGEKRLQSYESNESRVSQLAGLKKKQEIEHHRRAVPWDGNWASNPLGSSGTELDLTCGFPQHLQQSIWSGDDLVTSPPHWTLAWATSRSSKWLWKTLHDKVIIESLRGRNGCLQPLLLTPSLLPSCKSQMPTLTKYLPIPTHVTQSNLASEWEIRQMELYAS